MNLSQIAIQLLGIAGMTLTFFSFQCKNTKYLYLLQSVSGIFFTLNFYFLEAYTGAVLNALNILRSAFFVFCKTPRQQHIGALLLCLGYLAAGIVTYNGWLTILILFAQIVGTVTMGSGSGKLIRLGQLFCVSPLWLIHNTLCHSVGGILTEVFNIVSVIGFICRVGWKQFLRQRSI